MNKIFTAIIALLSFTSIGYCQTSAEDWFEKGQSLSDEKKYEDAIEAFNKAVVINPNYAEAFFQAGWCYNDLGKYTQAIGVLKKAVAIKKDYAFAWQELGFAYKKTENFTDALKCINTAIALKPDYALAYQQLGSVNEYLKKPDEAIAAYKKCYLNDNKNADACYNIGYIYNEKGKYEMALDWLKKSIEIEPYVDTYNEMGYAYFKLKKNDEAIKAYENSILLVPTKSNANIGIGDVYRINFSPAKTDKAIEFYKKAIDINEESGNAFYGLGWCYNEKENFDSAIVALQKCIEYDKTYTNAFAELGWAQFSIKKYDESLATLKEGIKLDKGYNLFWYYAGLVYVDKKDKINAKKMYVSLKPLDGKLAEKLLRKINGQ
jgi:tetratricopeptide (TPR) repeat protein